MYWLIYHDEEKGIDKELRSMPYHSEQGAEYRSNRALLWRVNTLRSEPMPRGWAPDDHGGTIPITWRRHLCALNLDGSLIAWLAVVTPTAPQRLAVAAIQAELRGDA